MLLQSLSKVSAAVAAAAPSDARAEMCPLTMSHAVKGSVRERGDTNTRDSAALVSLSFCPISSYHARDSVAIALITFEFLELKVFRLSRIFFGPGRATETANAFSKATKHSPPFNWARFEKKQETDNARARTLCVTGDAVANGCCQFFFVSLLQIRMRFFALSAFAFVARSAS